VTELVSRRLASLRAILMQSDADLRAQLPEYFLTYYTYLRILRNPARIEHVFQKGREMFEYLEADGKEVLDLGAGFGIEALLVAIYGAKRVVATEIDRDMVAVGAYLAKRIDPPVEHFDSRYGDGISMEFPDASFDGVMTNCVISHVRDLEGFLAETHRLLRPGGVFFLSDENNSLYLPALGGNQLLEAVRVTRGTWGPQIAPAVRQFLEGRRPAPPDFLYRDPRDGQYPERELNPFWMMQKFQEARLEPELLPAFFSRAIEVHPRQVVKDILRFFCTRWPVLSVYLWPIMRLRGRKAR
jgi:SAM-dependent methyltransferase